MVGSSVDVRGAGEGGGAGDREVRRRTVDLSSLLEKAREKEVALLDKKLNDKKLKDRMKAGHKGL